MTGALSVKSSGIKYLYVLASDDTDYYLEQALLSVTSLKMRMPDAFISLLVDDVTEKTLVDKRREIIEMADELKVVEIGKEFNKKQRSRWLKTSMRNLIEGDFIYIDCDTLDGIEQHDIDLGDALDKHCLLDDHHMKEYIQINDKKAGFSSSFESVKHFNSGVLWCRDSPACHAFLMNGINSGFTVYQKKL